MDMVDKNDLELLTINEVKELLKCTRRTVYNYLKSGKLKAFKIGGQWRCTKQNIVDFINGVANAQQRI